MDTPVSLLERLRRPAVTCRIGPPFRLASNGRAKGARLDELTDEIMTTLAAMLPPEYRGVYADHPGLRDKLAGVADVAAAQA